MIPLERKIKVKVCPKCLNPKIKRLWYSGFPQEYLCEECGYRGIIVLEIEIPESEAKYGI